LRGRCGTLPARLPIAGIEGGKFVAGGFGGGGGKGGDQPETARSGFLGDVVEHRSHAEQLLTVGHRHLFSSVLTNDGEKVDCLSISD
jgi:hypothetical protein